jgi:hypothetical protein
MNSYSLSIFSVAAAVYSSVNDESAAADDRIEVSVVSLIRV